MTAATPAAASEFEQEAQEAFERRSFGFWLYLMSDAVIFALLFATYAVMLPNTADGPGPQELFSLPNAFAETMLLLVSSATFGFASFSMRTGKRSAVVIWALITVALGLGFVALELREFTGLIAQDAGPDRSGFLSSFFALVGTHGLHVSFGMLGMLVMVSQVIIKGLTPPVCSRLERLGMFWHFLDIVWVGIFSVVYLPGVL